jgi:hypothetical protein
MHINMFCVYLFLCKYAFKCTTDILYAYQSLFSSRRGSYFCADFKRTKRDFEYKKVFVYNMPPKKKDGKAAAGEAVEGEDPVLLLQNYQKFCK